MPLTERLIHDVPGLKQGTKDNMHLTRTQTLHRSDKNNARNDQSCKDGSNLCDGESGESGARVGS
jgi:hypothetical protein